MLPESNKGRLFLLLLNEVSYPHVSGENNPYTFTYPHTWEKPSALSMMMWDFIEVFKVLSLELKKKQQNSNNKTKSNVGTSPYKRIF